MTPVATGDCNFIRNTKFETHEGSFVFGGHRHQRPFCLVAYRTVITGLSQDWAYRTVITGLSQDWAYRTDSKCCQEGQFNGDILRLKVLTTSENVKWVSPIRRQEIKQN